MAVLEYASEPQGRRSWRRWAVAAISGAAIGSGVAIATFGRVLWTLSRGRQLAVFDVMEPFEKQVQRRQALRALEFFCETTAE